MRGNHRPIRGGTGDKLTAGWALMAAGIERSRLIWACGDSWRPHCQSLILLLSTIHGKACGQRTFLKAVMVPLRTGPGEQCRQASTKVPEGVVLSRYLALPVVLLAGEGTSLWICRELAASPMRTHGTGDFLEGSPSNNFRRTLCRRRLNTAGNCGEPYLGRQGNDSSQLPCKPLQQQRGVGAAEAERI